MARSGNIDLIAEPKYGTLKINQVKQLYSVDSSGVKTRQRSKES